MGAGDVSVCTHCHVVIDMWQAKKQGTRNSWGGGGASPRTSGSRRSRRTSIEHIYSFPRVREREGVTNSRLQSCSLSYIQEMRACACLPKGQVPKGSRPPAPGPGSSHRGTRRGTGSPVPQEGRSPSFCTVLCSGLLCSASHGHPWCTRKIHPRGLAHPAWPREAHNTPWVRSDGGHAILYHGSWEGLAGDGPDPRTWNFWKPVCRTQYGL